jgi:hypothetical protein
MVLAHFLVLAIRSSTGSSNPGMRGRAEREGEVVKGKGERRNMCMNSSILYACTSKQYIHIHIYTQASAS